MTQSPASIIYSIYYRKNDKIYRINEAADWTDLSLIQLEDEIKNHILTDEKYIIIYDHTILNKKDYWLAFPEKVNKDELEFWYSYGLLSEEEYLCF